MKIRPVLVFIVGTIIFLPAAYGWNFGNLRINSLIVEKSGDIRFTLFERDSNTDEVACSGTNTWFKIEACDSTEPVCISAVDRISSVLVAAKLAEKPVLIERNGCVVTEVALRD